MDNYRRISVDVLKERIRKGDDVLLLDVRPINEFDEEHIDGSKNIPIEMLNVEQFLKEYEVGPIYLICATGKKAYDAAEKFQNAGCSDVIVIAGGLLSWRVQGFPLIKKPPAAPLSIVLPNHTNPRRMA